MTTEGIIFGNVPSGFESGSAFFLVKYLSTNKRSEKFLCDKYIPRDRSTVDFHVVHYMRQKIKFLISWKKTCYAVIKVLATVKLS